MMGGLRAFAQSWAGKLVLILLAVLLMGSGIVGSISLFTSSRVSSGIQAGGQNVNELEIAQEARNIFFEVAQPFEQVLGQPLVTAEAFEQFGLMPQVRETTQARLVNEIAFKEQAIKLGVGTSQADLSNYIRETFQDPVTGVFNERTMARSLANQGLTERAFLRDISEDLSSRRLFSAADDIAFDNDNGDLIAAVPQAVAMAQFNSAWSRYDVSYFAIPATTVEVSEPTDAVLAAILAENPDDYQRPEYRTFAGIFMTPEDLIDSIEVSEEDIQAEYKLYTARAEISKQWHLRQLFVSSEDDANAIVAATRAGATFVEAALAQGAGEPLDLGPRGFNYGRAAINEAFVEATETGILDPIADGNRFALIDVYEITTPTLLSLEEFRPEAERSIAAPQAETILSSRFEVLDGLVGTLSLEEAAAEAELPLTTGSIAESGADARIEGVPFNAKINGEIFSSPVGQTGFRNTFGENGLFIVRVDGVEEARALTFDEAKQSLTAAYTTDTRSEMLTALGEEALAAVTDQASLDQYVADNSLEALSQEGLTLADLLRFSVPTSEIAGKAAGDVVGGVTNTGYNVVLIRDARAADAELDAEALDGIEFQLARQYDAELQRAFREAVRETVNVTVNDKVLDRSITSGLNAYLDLRSGGTGQVRLEGVDYGGGHGGGY